MLQGIALSRLSNKVEKSIIERRALGMKLKENAMREASLNPIHERIPAVARVNQNIQQRPTAPIMNTVINPGTMQVRPLNPEAVKTSIAQDGNIYKGKVSVGNSIERPILMQNTVRNPMVTGSQPNVPMQQRVVQNAVPRATQDNMMVRQNNMLTRPMQNYAHPPPSIYQNTATIRSSQSRPPAPIQNYGAGQVRPTAMAGNQVYARPAPQTITKQGIVKNTDRNADSNSEEEEEEHTSKKETHKNTNTSQASIYSQQRISTGTVPVLNKSDGKIYHIPVEKMMSSRLMSQDQ